MQFIDLKRQYKKFKIEIDQQIKKVLDHGQYIMGPEVFELEDNLADFVNSKNAISCGSGTDALLMSLMALNVKPGDFVLTTPFTYIATAEVISLVGAIPVFIDIDPHTFNIDIDKLEQALKQNPNKYQVVIPVSIFGLPADFKELEKLKVKYNLKIIEDAAQSFGSSVDGKMSCSFGDIGCTSFFPAKPLGCYGDGGSIFTDDDNLAEILKSIRIHGTGADKYHNIRVGINGRLDTIQAAILIIKLKAFSNEVELRNKVAEQYNDNLKDSFGLQMIPSGYISSWAQYSILCNSDSHRNSIIEKLNDKKIPNAIYYSIPLHLQKVYEQLNYKKGDLLISEDISSRIISLPMHPYLSSDEIDKICNAILD